MPGTKTCKVCGRDESQVKFEPTRAVCFSCRGRRRRGSPIKANDADDFEITVDPTDLLAKSEIARKKQEQEARARAERLASDITALRPGDTAGETYSAERRREYTEQMGDLAVSLRSPESLAEFTSTLAEQERRWNGRRLARSVSLSAARELLVARQFEQIAAKIVWPVRARGYAAQPKLSPARRLQTLIISDLHIGAILPGYENPEAFDFTAASRRLAHLAYEQGEIKTQYRDMTHLNLGINGDVMEGLLEHNDADNAPFAEQMVAATQFLTSVVEYLAKCYPMVRVYCTVGNHGRIKSIHKGRATSSSWNAYETVIYKQVEAQCMRALPNVSFSIPKSPWALVPVFDNNIFQIHADREIKLKAPSSSGGRASWELELLKMQATQKYGKNIKVVVGGHFHDPDWMPFKSGHGIAQGALIPSNGYARAAGYDSAGGFFTFESTEKFVVGEMRFLPVGPEQDSNSSLDDIAPKFNPW